MRCRPTFLLVAVAVLLFAVPSTASACIDRHSVAVASGTNPAGEPWTLESTISGNGSCRGWLLDLSFSFPSVGSWSTGSGIPAGGHVSRNYRIDAMDTIQEDGAERVFAGIVSGEVATAMATLSNGKRLKIQPRSAPAQLRRHVVWLRGFRYFVQYYPPEGFVTSVSLFSTSGQLLYRTNGMEGSFF